MQILQRSAILIFALYLTSNTAFADNKLKNQELIEKSGLAAQLKELPGAMQASVGTLRAYLAFLNSPAARKFNLTLQAC